MRPLDWVVLAGTLLSIVAYGLYRGRGSNTVNSYLLASKTMPWYAMALSIMATQASAITFISTTAQGYVDGIRFVQFYIGLPIAMVILAATVVPAFHRANVYTAYEYLEKRFDSKTRALVSTIFLIERGLADGVALCAPSIVLTVVLGWPDRVTVVVMGALVVTYTVMGGIKAVTWTEVQQMIIIFLGLAVALGTAIWLLPRGVGFGEAFSLAGAVGKLNAVDLHFDWDNRYNIWSGLLGGTFLFLAYFGTDQSQVQRYLTGRSIAQSRLSLLFNAVAKIPMQFLILITGAMVFVFFIYERPPLIFHPGELQALEADPAYHSVDHRFRAAFEERRQAASDLLAAKRTGDAALHARSLATYRSSQKEMEQARADGISLVEKSSGTEFNDTNYIFLLFVTRYMPAGIVGLIIAVVFVAATSSTAAEVNSLATVSVIDVYRRHICKDGTDRHYLWASRIASAPHRGPFGRCGTPRRAALRRPNRPPAAPPPGPSPRCCAP